MEFAKNLREFRRRKNLTQEQLANIVNVSPQAVSKWETSDTLPDAALLPEIAKALDTSIDALFSYTSSNNMNVFQAVRKYINESDESEKSLLAEQIERIYNLMVASEKSRRGYDGTEEEPLGPEYWDYYSNITREPRYDIAVASSQSMVSCDEATMWMFESKLFPFASVFLQPEEGYTKIFRDNPNIEQLFAALGDHDVYQCLMYLLTQEEKSIELSALLKKAGISSTRTKEIRTKLSEIDQRSIRIYEDSVNGKNYTFVSYTYPHGILMLLATAYACTVYKFPMNKNNFKREKPIL